MAAHGEIARAAHDRPETIDEKRILIVVAARCSGQVDRGYRRHAPEEEEEVRSDGLLLMANKRMLRSKQMTRMIDVVEMS
jgi:hypothetical protein